MRHNFGCPTVVNTEWRSETQSRPPMGHQNPPSGIQCELPLVKWRMMGNMVLKP